MVYLPGNEAAGFYLLFDEYLQEEKILKPCRETGQIFYHTQPHSVNCYMNNCRGNNCVIHWIEICAVDNAIHSTTWA